MKPVKKAVITAAGRGTRQYPASSAVQKEMFPLVDTDGIAKTVIQIIGEEALNAGVEEICVVTQPGDERQYRDYFRRMNEDTLRAYQGKDWAIRQGEKLQSFGERLRFVVQHSPEGYGHAVYQAKEFVGDDPFLLMLGDHIYISSDPAGTNCATQMIHMYEEAGRAALTGVQIEPESLIHRFGSLKGKAFEGRYDLFDVEAIIEKPKPEEARRNLQTAGMPAGMYLCHFGLHVFPPAIFDALEYHITNDIREKNEIQLTNAQEYMRRELLKGDYAACTIRGTRFDTGIPYGLMESQLALALAGVHRGAIVEAIARLLSERLASISRK